MSGRTPARDMSDRAVRRRSCRVQLGMGASLPSGVFTFGRAASKAALVFEKLLKALSPRPANTYGLLTMRGLPFMVATAAGGSFSAPPTPFSLAAPGTVQTSPARSDQRMVAIFSRRWAVSSATRAMAPKVPAFSAWFQTRRSSSSDRMRSRLVMGCRFMPRATGET